MPMKIVVTGKGGREHALLRALSESGRPVELYACPGSDAVEGLARRVTAGSPAELVGWMKANDIDLCVAGEEAWLVEGEGLANLCRQAGIPCWGPVRQAAMLEASKQFAKEFMQRHRIPTAGFHVAASAAEARGAVQSLPVVLKFDGLAAGKGVRVCTSWAEVDEFLAMVFTEQRFGAGKLVVEECLEGPEISIFAAVADADYQLLACARDYKRLADGDEGPNTGGMGAVASRALLPAAQLQQIEREVIRPTVDGLMADGLGYRGFLYFGLMLTADGAKVLEYNCRFGDPECQVVMPLMRGDFAGYLRQAADGQLATGLIELTDGWSVGVILASAGYPDSSRSGDRIEGLDEAAAAGARVYHAGTRRSADGGGYETNGGRVLAVVATAPQLDAAVSNAYLAAQHVRFDGSQRRGDIGRLHFES